MVAAAHAALDRYGYGMASVRFICGTQEEHKELEARIAGFLGMGPGSLWTALVGWFVVSAAKSEARRAAFRGGAGGANLQWLDRFVESHFDDKAEIILAMDTDKRGVELRDELVRRLGVDRCKVVA